MCAELVDHISQMCDDLCTSLAESLVIDERIERLREESAQVRHETEKTVREMSERFSTERTVQMQENDSLRHQIQSITADLDSMRRANAELQASLASSVISSKQLQATNDELLTQLQAVGTTHNKHDHPQKETVPIVVLPDVVADLSKEAHTQEIRDLQSTNQSLKRHIDFLDATIAEWKHENESLRESLSCCESKWQSKEAEYHRLLKKASQLESAVQDERLKNKKAVELVKTIKEDLRRVQRQHPIEFESVSQTQPALSRGGNMPASDLEHLFEERVADIQKAASPIRAANMTAESSLNLETREFLAGIMANQSGDSSEIDKLLRLIKGSENTSIQLANFGHVVEELTEENKVLREAARENQEKQQRREDSWLSKIEELRDDYAKSVGDCEQLDAVLSDYEKQFGNILIFTANISNIASPEEGHPYPFAALFSQLNNEYATATHHSALLQQRVTELQQTVEAKESQLQTQIAALDTMSLNSQQQKGEIHDLQRQNESLARKLDELKREMRECHESRKTLEHKLKKIVSMFKTSVIE
eukprot:jgi/Hompol1/342/HPOL_004244-RA